MSNLCNPYRLPPPVYVLTAPFVAPLFPAYQSVQYNKFTRDIPLSTMINSKQFSGTFAYRCGAAPGAVQWPYIYAFGNNVASGNTTPLRLCYNGNDGSIYLLGRRISDAVVIYNRIILSAAQATDGSVYRVAFQIDLDNLANCKTWLNGTPTTWGAFGGDNTITPEWASCTMGTILGDPGGTGAGFPVATGVWTGMLSFSPTYDLDPSAVFDGAGYFTDPGIGFRNWYSGNKPAFGFISSPAVNQGYIKQLGGMRFNHATPLGHQMETTAELRHQLTGVVDGGGFQVNPGIGY